MRARRRPNYGADRKQAGNYRTHPCAALSPTNKEEYSKDTWDAENALISLKVAKSNCGGHIIGKYDLISRLPDEIITHILSFMPTNSAVATSLLSKRWNYLWTFVPCLDFGKYRAYWARDYSICEKFVDRVLTLNKVSCVSKICLQHDKHPHISRANAWISSIAKRVAEEINLRLHTCPDFLLPDTFFNNNKLVKLKLSTGLCLIPQSVSFPNLKTIHLRCFRLDGEDSIKNLMFGCPVLKNLYIRLVHRGDARTFDISSPTLEILQLQILYGEDDDDDQLGQGSPSAKPTAGWDNIAIDAPNLRDLDLEVESSETSFNMKNTSSLAKLKLCVVVGKELVRNMGILGNLSLLEFEVTVYNPEKSFPRLLLHTPNLVAFTLYCHTHSMLWKDPSEVPHCLMSCLESAEIWIDLMEPGEVMEMIPYILKNAIVLKKLSIMIRERPLRPGEVDEFFKALLVLPRTSATCHVYQKKWVYRRNNSDFEYRLIG